MERNAKSPPLPPRGPTVLGKLLPSTPVPQCPQLCAVGFVLFLNQKGKGAQTVGDILSLIFILKHRHGPHYRAREPGLASEGVLMVCILISGFG